MLFKGISILKKVVVLSFLFYCLPVFAERFELFNDLNEIAKSFLTKNISLDNGETLDIQVTQPKYPSELPKCSREIDATFPADANREQPTAVELTCNGNQQWHTFIPVTVQIYTDVIIAKRNILPNETLTEADIEHSRYSKMYLYSGYYKDNNEVLGQVATRMIPAGMVLTKKNLQWPLLVHRNQVVDLISRNNAIVVTMKGITKSDGSLNESIKVYNPSSKQIVDAVVVGPNKAEVIS